MVWWVRFCLGLPARPEDVEEMRNSLPELLSPDIKLSQKAVIPIWPYLLLDESKLGDLRRWAGSSELIVKEKPSSLQDCPASDCPLRPWTASTDKRSDGSVVLKVMIAGGASKPPKDEFLDLVRRVHKGQSIREVILSDPFIYLDVGEDYDAGGYNNLVDYLRALNLEKNSEFILKLNPSPKKATRRAQELFRREITKAFPKAVISTFKSGLRIHDRFYLVRDNSGILSGVFGPSLNGLGSQTVVLMGELERTKTLERLDSIV